jgi:hypothetical protein
MITKNDQLSSFSASEIIITYCNYFAPRTVFAEISHTCVCTVLHREINETEDSNINKFLLGLRNTSHRPHLSFLAPTKPLQSYD